MTDILEISENDYGYSISVVLYKNDDATTVENLTTASSVSLDITRCDETSIVSDHACSIDDASGGEISFTPESDWFTDTVLGNRNYYMAIFKINYAGGCKSTYKIPVYIHRN